MTICWLTSCGLMGVDTRPGCKLGNWARPEAWPPWGSGAGEGGCSAVLPGIGCWLKPMWFVPGGERSGRFSISAGSVRKSRRRTDAGGKLNTEDSLN
ncbi:hypothetical protein AAFF_G00404740 [Aldrovandia affinis]|uniref:Uncharacterized protein n=1 Tax=Aldrovandia affinis TaxID=143900 RepID=A0AAD7X0E9_9TELE|nr:hypothetical protein AAFF_G00404740 [Aldrovandia affinis]